MGKKLQNKINQYIATWEQRCYTDGIPDAAPIGIEKKVPSYQRLVSAIIKNDHQLKSLGEVQGASIWYDTLKKIELSQRGVTIQLKLL